MTTAFQPGDRVKLTGKFLKSTGQQAGPEGQRVWTVVGNCSSGFVMVDQDTSSDGYFSAEELAAQPDLKWRRFHPGNLFKLGTLTPRNDP